jgi:hypothetical protein
MKSLPSIFATLLLLFCGHAQAQFSQPPPNRPAPVCDREKSDGATGLPVGSDCKADLLLPNTRTKLTCRPYGDELYCVASTEAFNNGAWILLAPSTLTHDWAFKVDGQEYYYGPTNQNSVWIDCGDTRRGYVRVTAGWSTAQTSFYCPSSGMAW